jgi:uncharacterized protein (DUF1499 family)
LRDKLFRIYHPVFKLKTKIIFMSHCRLKMLKISIIFGLFIVAAIVFLFVLGIISRSGTPPGLKEGKLSKCPDRPNCVCSEYAADTDHYAAPIILAKNITDNHVATLRAVIIEMGGKIISEKDYYLAATFTSALFGFIDDLELRVDKAQNVIHIRSASRVGYGDMGVNRKRVEQLKDQFGQSLNSERTENEKD